ncbi:DUF4399 domain-containing protein [Azospirillum sp. HJ39]|uniref:DUF4399 domain-containing protein n=1 Tax=Azospirillum sp. HJ39 TaxID=3159496 RepID=UPI003558FE50
MKTGFLGPLGISACAALALAAAGAMAADATAHSHAEATGSGAGSPPIAAQPQSPRTPGRKDAWLYIGWPNNGQVVGTRFKVWFGLRNFGVAPAGVRKDGTGHHHLLIDTDLKEFDGPIPSNKQHLHFGKGQTETVLELPPGRHTLQLVLADADHVPHDPPILSKKIAITVRADRNPQLSAR